MRLPVSTSAVPMMVSEPPSSTLRAAPKKRFGRCMAEKRVYPSILLNKSGTRREELLLKPEILQKTWILRKLLYPMDEIEAMEFILDKMKSTKTNLDFFDMMRRGG